MKEHEKKKIIDDAHETIDDISNSLKVDGSKAKDYINNLNESDLNFLKELEEIVRMLKKPFWKWVIGIILVNSILSLFYQLGYWIGKLIATLGL